MPIPRSQLLSESDLAPTLNSQFESDKQKAQDDYARGLKAGYDETTADSLFLAPFRSKWKIINQSPQLLQDKTQLDKFNRQYDSSISEFHKNLGTYSRDSEEWAANQIGSINPLLQNWSIQGSIPATANRFDPSVEAKALKDVSSGSKSAADVISENPGVLLDPESRAMWTGLVRAEIAGGKKGKVSARQAADIAIAKKNYTDAVSGGDSAAIAKAADALDSVAQSALPNIGTTTATSQPATDVAPVPASSNPDELSPYFASIGFHAPNAQPAASTTEPTPAEALTRKPLVYITGGKGNTVDRAGADAAWQAQFGSLPDKSSVTSTVTIPSPKDLVSVINPQGKRVRIAKAQLDDALRQGYSQP